MTGSELIIGPVASGLVQIILDLAQNVGGEFLQDFATERKITQAMKTYINKYKSRYGLLKLLGMPQPIELESVYTPIQFLDKLSIRRFESIEVLEEAYRRSRQSNQRKLQFGKRSKQDGILVANENQFLMVLGGPGAGKSTFLRKVGLEALKGEAGRFSHDCIPILLELRRFNNSRIDLVDAIAKEFEDFGFPPSLEFTRKALETGKLLVLFDGLDEIPKDQVHEVTDAIQAFTTQYERNRFIASCRIAAYKSSFQKFRDIELADFDSKQIRQFIFNWFQSNLDKESSTAEKCWEELNEPINISAKELAQTPLLLTFLCLVFDNSQGFPSQRSRLYDEALDILLKKWAAEKRVKPGEIYQGLNPDLEKVLLSEIAYQSFISDQLFLSKEELVEHIKGFLSDTVDKPKYLDGEAVLNSIAIQQGVLVERVDNVFSFSHLTLQEYLTAFYINQQDDALFYKILAEYLVDKRWREIFLLIPGLVSNSDSLLTAIEEKAQEIIDTPRLQSLINLVDSVTMASDSTLKSSQKRAIALATLSGVVSAISYLEQNLSNYDYHLTSKPISPDASLFANTYVGSALFKGNFNAISDAYLNISNDAYESVYRDELDKVIEYVYRCKQLSIYSLSCLDVVSYNLENLRSEIPSRDSSIEKRQYFSQQLLRIWLEAFDLEIYQITLSDKEMERLEDYCYVNLLVINCKRTSIRVSRKTWEQIESKMLLPQHRR